MVGPRTRTSGACRSIPAASRSSFARAREGSKVFSLNRGDDNAGLSTRWLGDPVRNGLSRSVDGNACQARNTADQRDAIPYELEEHGYNATGMRDVMAATGISSGALHHHFRTKHALAMAVIADRVAPAVRETWIDPVRKSSSLSKSVAEIFADLIHSIGRQGYVRGCPSPVPASPTTQESAILQRECQRCDGSLGVSGRRPEAVR